MTRKIWHKVQISTEEQNVALLPNEGFDGIIVEVTELDGSPSHRLHLSPAELEFLITKMQEMVASVTPGRG